MSHEPPDPFADSVRQALFEANSRASDLRTQLSAATARAEEAEKELETLRRARVTDADFLRLELMDEKVKTGGAETRAIAAEVAQLTENEELSSSLALERAGAAQMRAQAEKLRLEHAPADCDVCEDNAETGCTDCLCFDLEHNKRLDATLSSSAGSEFLAAMRLAREALELAKINNPDVFLGGGMKSVHRTIVEAQAAIDSALGSPTP